MCLKLPVKKDKEDVRDGASEGESKVNWVLQRSSRRIRFQKVRIREKLDWAGMAW